MKLIVGLGNPGEKYASNRHNIGFMAVDELARGYSFGPWKRRFQGLAAEGQIGVEKCLLLKPATYMNESGRSAGEAMRFYKLSADDVIAVHDELDLQPGTVRVKKGGGNAGHNGLKSISAYIGNDYTRVRLGIGHPGDKALVVNYVLQDFTKADRQWLDPFLVGIARGMSRLVEGGDASFLSEAARGRPAAAAAKLNGATPAVARIKAEAPKIQAITPIPAAAATARAEPTLVPGITVVAAREGGGGGAVSKAVIMPEPLRPAPPPETAPKIERAPEPAPAQRTEAARVIQPVIQPALAAVRPEAPAAPAPAKIERAPEPAPRPAPRAEPAPVIQAQPVRVAVREEAPAPSAPPVETPASAAQKGAESKPQAAAVQKKKPGLFRWWFRMRVRGGYTREMQ